ncbi:MAG TPA: DUF1989 domain-containing protein [Xanthobacteraceae bacterium]
MTLVEDTSGGVHDTQFAATPWGYELIGYAVYHGRCADNLKAALSHSKSPSFRTLNLFMNISVIDGNQDEVRPPVSILGSGLLCSPRSIASAFSACAHDLLPVDGLAMQPIHAHF